MHTSATHIKAEVKQVDLEFPWWTRTPTASLGLHMAPCVVLIGRSPRVFPLSGNGLSSYSEIIFDFSFSLISHFQSIHHQSCQLFFQSIFQILFFSPSSHPWQPLIF